MPILIFAWEGSVAFGVPSRNELVFLVTGLVWKSGGKFVSNFSSALKRRHYINKGKQGLGENRVYSN
jgi:hypothetical protein